MAKKKQEKPARLVIQNCTFIVDQNPQAEKRAEAVKELAIALGKAADALLGPINTAPMLTVNQDRDGNASTR